MTVGENDLIFAKVKPDAIIPSKREEDGCYDLYACFNDKYIIIQPHTNKLISTGIASAFSPKYRLALRERGTNTKSTLMIIAGQIDSGYRGEIFVSLYNGNDIPVMISKGIESVINDGDVIYVPYTKAICQFAIEEVPQMTITELTYKDLLMIKSERGTGKLGSSLK